MSRRNVNIWEDARNVLCVRLDTIGDVLMTTPAIRALKESTEGRRVTLLTSSAGAGIASLIPEVDRVMIYDAPWLKATAPRKDSRPELEMIGRLHGEGFDAAVIFTVFSQNPLPSAYMCYCADIPLRLSHCRENPYQLLSHWIKDPEPAPTIRHEVQRQLDLVAQIGCRTSNPLLSLQVSPDTMRRVVQMLQGMGIFCGDIPLIVIHPGASASSRRYSSRSFAKVVRQLAGRVRSSIVFTGSAGEEPIIEEICSTSSVASHSFAGRLTLEELAALISVSHLLITNNTGPAHIAAAVGTPVVDLYALTNPQHTPWHVPSRVLFHDVPCKYCYKSICPEGHQNCLGLVAPEVVVDAAEDLLIENDRVSRIKEFLPP
jgi:lipopolysaccharide heptosyltransferase II